MKKECASILMSMTFVALLITYMSSCAFGTALAKITLKVIDEDGKPVKDAKVGAAFMIYTKGGWASTSTHKEGMTDDNGIYEGSALADNKVAFSVKKSGYYDSYGTFKFETIGTGRWEPWNPEIKVVLRKIENQAPMYQRDTKKMYPVLEIPITGKPVGYDLMESDWVSPHGKGKHADMFFRLDRQYVNVDDFDGTLTITFPDEYDGIQVVKYDRESGSNYKLPRFAPEDGYQAKLVRTFSKKPGEKYKKSAEDDNNYFLRVRSEEKDGKFFRAMYGKIHGDIRFDMRDSKTASIIVKYFLNPDYTRNMESGKNLLKLRDGEQVGLE